MSKSDAPVEAGASLSVNGRQLRFAGLGVICDLSGLTIGGPIRLRIADLDLAWFGCLGLREPQAQHAVFEIRLRAIGVDLYRKRDRATEGAARQLVQEPRRLGGFGRLRHIRRRAGERHRTLVDGNLDSGWVDPG